jgi:hypothetical protein
MGLLLLIVSFLFLPWYLDPSPEPGQSPGVTGVELIDSNTWIMVMAYGLILMAYGISRFSSRKWAGVIPFMAAFLLFLYLHISISIGSSLSRPVSSLESYGGVRALVGTRVNWGGLASLALGLYFATPRQERSNIVRSIVWPGAGALVGFGFAVFADWLFWLSSPIDDLLYLGLPIAGAIVNVWLGLRRVRSAKSVVFSGDSQ